MNSATRALTVELPIDLADEVDALAALIERPSQWIVKKALRAFITRQLAERRAIQEGLDDVTAGRTISQEVVQAWVDSLGADDEQVIPKA